MRVRALLAAVVAIVISGVTGMVQPSELAADEIRDDEWQLTFLRSDEAWTHSRGDGQIVAVIDSGVNAAHPDLAGQVLAGTDFVDGSTDGRSDVVGHGTTVASLIAGRADDDAGVAGLAPNAKILPIRVLDPNNQYDSAANVAQSVRWAVDRGATVINLSLGSADVAPVLTEALKYALAHDVVVVACNGNYSNERGDRIWHPAREPGVIAVSGVTNAAEFWSGSISGPQTVVAAPAVDLVGIQPDGGYGRAQGTSFAAPLVAATAALIRAAYPGLNAANVVNRIIRTTWDFGDEGFDSQFGFGIVNPARALTAEVPIVTANPLLPQNRGGGRPATGAPEMPGVVDGPERDSETTAVRRGILITGITVSTMAIIAAVVTIVVVRRRRYRTAPLATDTTLSHHSPLWTPPPSRPPPPPRPRPPDLP